MSTLESDSPQSTLWLIDDDPALRLILADTFSDADMDVVSFTQAKAAWTRLNDMLSTGDYSQLPDVILTDIRMPLMDGLSFSDWVHKKFPELPIIIMTAHSDLQSAVDSYQTGAFDYLPKPFDLDDAVATIKKAIKPRHQASVITAAEKDDSDSISLNQDSGDLKNNDMAALTQAEARQHKVLSNSPANVKPKPTSKTVAQSNVSIDSMATKHEAKVKPNNAKSAQPTKKGNTNPNGIIGQSPAMQTVFRAIGRLSHSPITVLITGESGTGKELVANALHQHSPRHNKPFIALNMAAIPHDLIESELFGHEKGAFTGAATLRQGRFEQANGGTLFLDEIGDMPFSTQTRLLRVLANGEFYRVGGQKPIKVDVRIIAATHQNLEHLVKLGKFREDLFYRLNVIRLPLPPLRERREDIPALVEHFMQRAAKEMDTAQKYIAPEALFIMQAFDWSGNVRQIENACRWLTVMATGDTVLAEDLPPELTDFINQYPASIPVQSPISAPLSSPASLTSEDSSTYPDASSQNTSTVQPNRPSSHADYNTGSSTANGRDIEVAHHHATVANPANTINTASLSHFTASAPPLTSETPSTAPYSEPWQLALTNWANAALARGETDILQEATPEFERILLTVALAHSKGRKGDAAALLGWGRNTLTRKLKLLDIE